MVYLWFVVAYLILVWVLMRLVVPHLGFKKEPLSDVLPKEFEAYIRQIDSESSGNLDFLRKSYEFVISRYKGSRVKTVTQFWKVFCDPITEKPGFMPCTGQNYLLRLMLVKSGRFKESDVILKVVPFNLFIHQYLRVRVNDMWMDVDPWSSFLGVPPGKKICNYRLRI